MKIVAAIPARFASTRFPGKPIAPILGKPMIRWVVDGVLKTGLFSEVVLATDDSRIADCVQGLGARVVMTDPELPSGTDRVFQATQSLDLAPQDVVVNIQGDEPLIQKPWLQALIRPFQQSAITQMSTLAHVLATEDLSSMNSVKVLVNQKSQAIYFSRFSIPFSRQSALQLSQQPARVFKHMGFYGYRVQALQQFCAAPQGFAEQAESLEQLRALELGMPIEVSVVEGASQGVDTPSDLEKIEALLRSQP